MLLITSVHMVSCEQNNTKPADTNVVSPTSDTGNEADKNTEIAWLSSDYDSPIGVNKNISKDELQAGEVKDAIETTFIAANSPIDIYNNYGNEGFQKIPFLAFVVEKDSKISVRHIKYLNGEISKSGLLVTFSCPKKFADNVINNQLEKKSIIDVFGSSDNSYELKCIPLVNAGIPDFLSAADINGIYTHEFTISVKFGAKKSSILSTKIVPKIVIPNSSLNANVSSGLRDLRLYDRYSIVTETKKNSGTINYGGRRDFIAFEINGTLAPGVKSSYVINTEDKLYSLIEEEVFYELPVVKGLTPANVSISRGQQFYKRKVSIDSLKHFGLRLYVIKNNGSLSSAINIPSTGKLAKPIEIPIEEPNSPLKIGIALDFGAEGKPLSSYFFPFSATFCENNPAYFFEPSSWLSNKDIENYIECDSFTRATINPSGKVLSNILSQETFFGSFSYLAQNSTNSLGGTNGIYSMRIHLTGNISIKIKNPGSNDLTEIGKSVFTISHMLPNVMDDMEDLIKNGRAPGGLDIIESSMRRKGVYSSRLRNNKKLTKGCTLPDSGDCKIEFESDIFPFQGQKSINIFY